MSSNLALNERDGNSDLLLTKNNKRLPQQRESPAAKVTHENYRKWMGDFGHPVAARDIRKKSSSTLAMNERDGNSGHI
ncbi:hypothetical protein NQ318_002090 [Aromia moschata]|uniref:Uncharacterized protein n=1 Tax=Aromia moschata TaxID=1265417 RepID=A0AAV8Y6S3_9CUCU|nr:hypothetical protein NQ318_002090 [Aromia moschata]